MQCQCRFFRHSVYVENSSPTLAVGLTEISPRHLVRENKNAVKIEDVKRCGMDQLCGSAVRRDRHVIAESRFMSWIAVCLLETAC